MKGLQLLGEYIWEFFIVSILLAVSAVLILPFIPMLIGVTGFFSSKKNVRRFKDIFTTIGRNFGIIALFTVFELVIIVFSVLNIYFFGTNPERINYFIMVLCCITLVIGVVFLINGPIIIVNMKVKFRQLVYNSFKLLSGGILRSLIAVAIVCGVVALIMFYPYLVPLTLYAVPYALTKLLTENFYVLKAKALKVSVYQLKNDTGKDNYLNEYGEVNHDDEDQQQDE